MNINKVNEPSSGWGGIWTRKKIEILVEYANAYLSIMKDRTYWKLLYFDGFAGSGIISKGHKPDIDVTIGAARRIVEIDEPRSFDQYYFVEKNKQNAELLKRNTADVFPYKNIFIKNEDCNVKLKDLASYLRSAKGKKTKVLAYIDPYPPCLY